MIQTVGYDTFSIEALAARAGVAKATIYRRWGSKEDLVVAAAARFVSAIPVPDLGDLRRDLSEVLQSDAVLYADPQTAPLLSSLLSAMARSPRIAAAVRAGLVASRETAIARVLERARERGETPANLDVRLAVQFCAGPFLYRTLVAGETADEVVVARFVDLFLNGLAVANATGDL